MSNNTNRIEQLKEEIFNNNNIRYHYLIIKLINNGKINELINRITDAKTKVNVTSLHKKKYLSSNEQFLVVLTAYIYRFKEDFYFLNNNFDCIIEILLQNEKYTEFILCKKDVGNNKYLSYFSYNTKRLIVYGFYNNVKKLAKKSNVIKEFAKFNKINLRKNLLGNENSIDILYNALINISICNAKNLNNTLLFEDINNYIKNVSGIYKNTSSNAKEAIYKYYIKEWENMITNFYEKKESTKILLK